MNKLSRLLYDNTGAVRYGDALPAAAIAREQSAMMSLAVTQLSEATRDPEHS